MFEDLGMENFQKLYPWGIRLGYAVHVDKINLLQKSKPNVSGAVQVHQGTLNPVPHFDKKFGSEGVPASYRKTDVDPKLKKLRGGALNLQSEDAF
jgi:hypothetical protein